MRGLTQLYGIPPYVDPVVRHVAHTLRRVLELRQRCPTGSALEVECRLGSFRPPSSSAYLANLPYTSSTLSIISGEDAHLYKFQNGVQRSSYRALEAALGDAGLSGGAVQHEYVVNTVSGERLLYKAVPPRNCDNIRLPSSEAVASLQSTVRKTPIRSLQQNVCCPEWDYDFRLAVAEERTLDGPSASSEGSVPKISGGDDSENDGWASLTPHRVVYRLRQTCQAGPYFTVQLGTELIVSSALYERHPWGPTIPFLRVGHVPQERSFNSVEVELNLCVVYADWRRFGSPSRPRLEDELLLAVASQQNDRTTRMERAAAQSCGAAEENDGFLFHLAQELLSLLQFLSRPPRGPAAA